MQDYSSKNMVDVYKKNIFDYLYSKTMQRFMFAFSLAAIFMYSLRNGYGTCDTPVVFAYIAIITIYLLFHPELIISPINFPFLVLTGIFFLTSIWHWIDNPQPQDLYNMIPYAWVVPTVYMMGNLIVGNVKNGLDKKSFLVLSTMAVGMYVQGILNYSTSKENFQYRYGYWTVTFWNSLTDGTRSTFNYAFFMIIGAMFYAFINRKLKRRFFILVAILSIFCVLLNLYFYGRTMPAMAIIVNAFMFVLYIFNGHMSIIERHKKLLTYTLSTVLLATVLSVLLVKLNVAGLGDIYINSFLARDGGIFHNVRLELWKGGIDYTLRLQKGGWSLDTTVYPLDIPHNSWLEYARIYDIVVFVLWIVFLVVSLIDSFVLFFKYGNTFKTLYFVVSAEIVFFIYSMNEPGYILYPDLIVFYIFLFGIASGIGRVARQGDYGLLGTSVSPCKYRYTAFGLGMLSIVFITILYMDWWNDRMNLLWIALPVIIYVVAGIILKEKVKTTIMFATSGVSLIAAVCMYIISRKSEFFLYGIYIELFTKNTVDKSVFLALLILPFAVVSGVILYYTKLNKIICAVAVTFVTGLAFISQIRDGRLASLKEAIRLQMNTYGGVQWIASRENYTGLTSSHCMWMDFARDYGMIILGLLLVFEVFSIYCFIRLVFKKERCVLDYMLIVAFILFNYHFMFEASAITSRYIFAIGLMVYGFISSSIIKDENKEQSLEWLQTKKSFTSV